MEERLVEEHARSRGVEEPLVVGETRPTTPLVADPPTALAVTAEGASCAARAVPSNSVSCMLAARRVPTDLFPHGVPGAGREPSASLMTNASSAAPHRPDGTPSAHSGRFPPLTGGCFLYSDITPHSRTICSEVNTLYTGEHRISTSISSGGMTACTLRSRPPRVRPLLAGAIQV